MDFYKVVQESSKSGIVIYPEFKVQRSKDLMVRGKGFYAVWNDREGLWCTDEYEVQRIIDEDLARVKAETPTKAQVKWMANFSSNSWKEFRSYMNSIANNYTQLDSQLTFSNTEVTKEDYVSRRLSYPLVPGDISAYDEIMRTLYEPSERAKLEWALGAVVAGDAKTIQKFIVLYGASGTGKSTFLNIAQKLFEGYYVAFEAKTITSASNSFAIESFKDNPLVAIDHDGDLSRVEDNSRLNSIVSHENITVNEKFKSAYSMRINSFLFMGTNKAVKITDAKSGIIRRLIDVNPSGNLLPESRYHILMNQIDFELGAIASHCLDVYRRMGKDYYSGYRPTEMILQTDIFYNFIEANYDIFRNQDSTTLQQAYELYKKYCEESNIEHPLPRHKFREELRNYFKDFHERIMIDGERIRSLYQGFIREKFGPMPIESHAYSLTLDSKESILDDILKDHPAQYAKEDGSPEKFWSGDERIRNGRKVIPKPDQIVTTTLSDLDTHKLHYVKIPSNHIVIDFDLKDENGAKSAEANIKAASEWPITYAEFSKSGAGVHLHYIYAGDPSELSRVYAEGIEVKVFVGDASLRRMLSTCNNVPVATLTGGLPLKEKKVINFDTVKSEKGLRNLIERNLRKEIHPGTKPSVDFIHKILEDAYTSGMSYDVTDMRPKIFSFAMNSTNQSDYCIELVNRMKFASEEMEPAESNAFQYDNDKLVFFDIEVFPNLLLICWKYQGSDQIVRMFNPTPLEVEKLFKLKLVGFNNRRYDNHIIYARYLGYSNEELYKLSLRILNKQKDAFFAEAYNLSYTDIYDFASAGNKKSLKRFQIELGISHKELGLPWDEPVPKEKWEEVADYCDNDVISEEKVMEHLNSDFVARQILADLSGLTVNDTTNKHSTKIIFGDERKPQGSFIYTDLSTKFPGYVYDFGKSIYRGIEVGEGGYVYAEPGMYTNVAVLDVASLHPTSIIELNLFGDVYTEKFKAIKDARVAIKHKDISTAERLLNRKFPEDTNFKGLSDALKTVINSVYGLTSASFENPFKDPRNKDNIVAKRGALFMVDLQFAVQERGFVVAHIKTDSIKIPNATPEIIQFVKDFGRDYGYDFEHEATYEKMCLVNDAVFIAKYGWAEDTRLIGKWSATGAQFAHPYVFKTLFSHEPIEFDDLCETKQVTTALYLDFNSGKPMFEAEKDYKPQFVGRFGAFCPVKEGTGGGLLLREKDGKFYSATGAKGYFWMEAEMVKVLDWGRYIDMKYFMRLADEALAQLNKYGDAEWFLSETKALTA